MAPMWSRMGKRHRALVCSADCVRANAMARALASAASIELLGPATSGGESLALVRRVDLEVVAIDGDLDSCDGLRLGGMMARERPLLVVLVVEPGRERSVREAAVGRGIARVVVCSHDTLEHGTTVASLAQALHGVRVVPSLASGRDSRVPSRAAEIRRDVATLARWGYDAVVVLGSAGTPHMLPRLLVDAPGGRLPLWIAVHHNPRFSEAFHTWLEETVGEKATRAVLDGAFGSVTNRLVVVAAAGQVGNELEPDLGLVLDYVIDTGARPLVCVASGMGGSPIAALRRARAADGRVVVLDPVACPQPAMSHAAIEAGLADAIASESELAWLIGNASATPLRAAS